MFHFKEKAILKAKINDININLENNYKDLAHSALTNFIETLEQMKKDGLNDRIYNRYKRIADDYTKKMKNYHH